MDPTFLGILGFVLILVLMSQRVPVAFAMIAVGLAGITILNSWPAAQATLVSQTWITSIFYELTVIPFFVLMGNVAGVCGMSRDLYNAANAWVGWMKGGLAHGTVLGCTGFAALSGSSVASALTIGRVALPEMARFGYDRKLAAGAVAAGGTLGILIPPSTGFVIYAILTEESIGRLFLAGVFPGLLLTALFMTTIYIQTRINPELGPAGPKLAVIERFKSLWRASAMVGIIVVTIGGIYSGFFTAGEAAGVGAFLAFLLALARRAVNKESLTTTLLQTVRTSAFAFLILIGAHVFNPFLALTQIPTDLTELLISTDLGPHGILFILLITFIVLGMFLEGFAILVLTLPIVHPLIIELGFDPIWFGVVMVVVLEMGLISPPVGINVFVVKGIAEDVPMGQIFAGILPFWLAMIICLTIIVVFPEIALFLPNTMFN